MISQNIIAKLKNYYENKVTGDYIVFLILEDNI